MRETHRQLRECVARGLTGCEWLGNSSLMQHWGQTGTRQGIQRKEGCWAKHLLFSLWLCSWPQSANTKETAMQLTLPRSTQLGGGSEHSPTPSVSSRPKGMGSESQSQQVQALTKGPTSVQCHPQGRNCFPVDQGLCLAWEGTALWKWFP